MVSKWFIGGGGHDIKKEKYIQNIQIIIRVVDHTTKIRKYERSKQYQGYETSNHALRKERQYT